MPYGNRNVSRTRAGRARAMLPMYAASVAYLQSRKTPRQQAIDRERNWLEKNGHLIEIGHRSPAYGRGRYPASPFIGKLPQFDKTFARRLFDNKWKYHKSKTRYPKRLGFKRAKRHANGGRYKTYRVNGVGPPQRFWIGKASRRYLSH